MVRQDALGLLIAAGILLFGAANMEVRSFQEAAAKEIQSRLTEPGPVSVQTKLNGIIGGPLGDMKRVQISARDFAAEGIPLYTEPERSQRGRIGQLVIQLDNFRLSRLSVQSLHAEIPECRYDYGLAARHRKIRLSRSGVGAGEVKITASALREWILHKFAEFKTLAVRIDQDKVFLEGDGEFLLVKSHFEVICRVSSPTGTTIEVSEARIWFDGERASAPAAQALLKKLNPVVDLNRDLKLNGAMTIQDMVLRDGVLTASGPAQIPVRPE